MSVYKSVEEGEDAEDGDEIYDRYIPTSRFRWLIKKDIPPTEPNSALQQAYFDRKDGMELVWQDVEVFYEE